MADIIAGGCVALLLIGAVVYIIRSKKKGKCAGCPYAGSCSKSDTDCKK